MEVHLTAEQEVRLAEIAQQHGKTDAGELLKDAALQIIEDDARICAMVLEAKAYADRGEFISEDEMNRRFEAMLQS